MNAKEQDASVQLADEQRQRLSSTASNQSNGSTQALYGSRPISTRMGHESNGELMSATSNKSHQSRSKKRSRLNNVPAYGTGDGGQSLAGEHDQEDWISWGRSDSLASSTCVRRASSRDKLLPSTVRAVQQPPDDRYKLVCFGFLILGITTLLPWNFFITATDYWMFKFRDVNVDYNPEQPDPGARTALQTFFESYLAIAANVPMLLSMLINSLYAQKFSQKGRLYVSLLVMLVVFTLTTIFVKINTDQMQTTFFTITLALVTLISLFSATFQAAVFGIVASFPDNCMHAMVNGQSLAGLLAVAIQLLSMLNNTGPIMSGLWYFLASTLFLALAIICYWLMDNEYSRYYLLLKLPDQDQLSTSISVNLIEDKFELFEALQDCWQMALSVVLAFWASLSVFPGVCVLVVPEHPNSSFFSGRFFVLVTTFLLFNLGDLVGRVSSSLLPLPASKRNALLVFALMRALVPPLILFCNVQPRYNMPVLFKNDIYFPVLVSFTALTNGYIFSSAMLMASTGSLRSRLELTGFVMASSLGIGLTFGSISSNLLLRFV